MAAQMQGVERLLQTLRDRSKRYGKNVSVSVGYSAPHATLIHEDLQMPHPRGGQAKYLEQPARQYSLQIAQVVRQEMGNGKTMREALGAGGTYLLSQSKPLVPVLTGELRDSGFVRID